MSKKVALITGITGQDGSYLTELLLAKGYEVHGIVRRASSVNTERIDHLFDPINPVGKKYLHYGDLAEEIDYLLYELQPDEVYNLGAMSHVKISFEIPIYTGNITGLGAARILEGIRKMGLTKKTKFYQASSSEMFGLTPPPQSENSPFNPVSPYGCAKLYAYHMTKSYRTAYGMFAVNGILFNHESERRGVNFVTRKITMTLAKILAHQQECLFIGNLEAKRDWGYAPEYVEGMWRMLQHPVPDDYVLATGCSVSVREFLEMCLRHACIPFERQGEGRSETYVDTRNGKTIVAVDPYYYRPTEVDGLCGDAAKACRVLGWEPKTTVEELSKIMLEADCKALGVELGARGEVGVPVSSLA